MGEGGHFQVWPGLAAPLGLTLVFGLAAWLFSVKLDGEREEAAAASGGLESHARLKASEIASAAAASAAEFVEARLAARRSHEQNLRIEAKGVMDALCRFLASSMEGAREKGAARREVGSFPSGFDGMRRFLELVPLDNGRDPAEAALEAVMPEIAGLLPAGFALSVVEDHAREVLAIGGTTSGEGVVSASVARDMMFDDGRAERRWTIRLDVGAPDQNPVPAAKDVAEFLERRLAEARPEHMSWRGWLIGDGNTVAASFPAEPRDGVSPPFMDAQGAWKPLDGGSLVWLERQRAGAGLEWDIGVSVLIAAPAGEPTLIESLQADVSWTATLAAIGFACLGSWGWFARAARGEFHGKAVNDGWTVVPPRGSGKPRPERRLVRDPGAKREIPEVEGVIVADVGADGKVKLSTPAVPQGMPSGSLARLQAIHRGRQGAVGSRILDHAKSPLLRELAERIRPRAPTPEATVRSAGPKAAGREGLPPPRPSLRQGTVTGWSKVDF